jgi:hypothetical protein
MRTSLSRPLRALLVDIAAIPPARPGRAERWASGARRIWTRLIESPRFPALLTWIFATWAVLSVVAVFELVLSLGLHIAGAQHAFGSDRFSDLRVVNIISLASSLVAAVARRRGDPLYASGATSARLLLVRAFAARVDLRHAGLRVRRVSVRRRVRARDQSAAPRSCAAARAQRVGAAEVRGGDRVRGLPRGDAGPAHEQREATVTTRA